MTIRIYGASDDAIELRGDIVEELYTYETGPVVWRGELRAPDGDTMRVHALFDGCWAIAVGQVDEDTSLLAWPVTIAPAPDERRSVMAEIHAPRRHRAGQRLADQGRRR
ncbi:hypothetical protein [Actinoallomurus sp. CA-142502]|uniref:hypothetical protein n=1 Tax=Actinoallomurus sp. CA-142502 TaxID=3239885 RepID=UPI003D8FF269